ncbi:DUF4365 domain-containing protein [Skermanella stibiiresistens]|uniref:DUF4365 domain-containing protein n=1 Tax=Skermanella stibiiresistens TaxID=913326 RepID=UPI0009FEC8E1|nr:DUF4365 domain-containing protein [Skermanella stibiiresistens]
MKPDNHGTLPVKPLSSQNVEAELSYAYLHAVASYAGMSCRSGDRHEDNAGIDAVITAWQPIPKGLWGWRSEVDIKIQLKATILPVVEAGDFIPYFLRGVDRYNDLRCSTLAAARILVIMFLPKNPTEWLNVSPNELLMKDCAYWTSLRAAPESKNISGETIYIPRNQLFSPASLLDLATNLSDDTYPIYRGRR